MSSWMTRYSLGIGNFMNADREHQCYVLVIGSGAAGLSVVLQVAQYGKVIVLSKGPHSEGATFMHKAVLQQSLMNRTVLNRMCKTP